MADIARKSTGVRVVRGGLHDYNHVEGRAGADHAAGDAVRFDPAAGTYVKADASAAANAKAVGLVMATVRNGMGCSALFNGEMDGFDLSALQYGQDVFLSNAAGVLSDTAGTTNKKIGTVINVNGDKILKVQVIA